MKWRKEEFGDRRSHVAGEAPINVKMTATGWLSNGISWDDFSRMQTRLKKTTGERRRRHCGQ